MTDDQAKGIECPLSKRVDGKNHTWTFDGGDPYIICAYCDEMRDAVTGVIVKKGRKK